MKTEEDIEGNMRRAQLWSIPAYLGTADPGEVPTTAKATESFRDVNTRARIRTQDRQMQQAQSTQGLQRRERPIRRVNCRLRIPGTDMVRYVHNAKTYHCPDGIEPWLAKDRWMLEPDRNIFRRFDSKVPFVDHKVYHHYTEDPFGPYGKVAGALHEKRRAEGTLQLSPS
jgi:hypothetical protein